MRETQAKAFKVKIGPTPIFTLKAQNLSTAFKKVLSLLIRGANKKQLILLWFYLLKVV